MKKEFFHFRQSTFICNEIRTVVFCILALSVTLASACDEKTGTGEKNRVSATLSGMEAGVVRYVVEEEAFFVDIPVTVRDNAGELLKDAVVSLVPEEDHVQIMPAEGLSDEHGKVVFSVVSSRMGTVRMTAQARSNETLDPGTDVELDQDIIIPFEVTISVEPTTEPDFQYDLGLYSFRLTLTDTTGPVVGARLAGQPDFNNVEVSPDPLTTDENGQAEFVAESTLRGEQSLLLELAGISPVLSVPVDFPSFGHGSVRPFCQYTLDPSRVPYFAAPVVVAGDWGEPVQLASPVTDACPNDAIELSPNGDRLYFFWSPTVGGTNQEILHITTGTYVAERIGDDPGHFSVPRFFDLQKETGGSADGAPSFTPDGGIVYFHSTRSENLGFQADPPTNDYLDIYMAPIINGEPGLAINLGEPVNSVYLDGEHALHPDGTELYLSSDRPGGEGGIDIWVTERIEGEWTNPVNPGPPLNTVHWEGQPGFSAADPDTMYFVSNRDGPSAIYRPTREGNQWSDPELVITGYVGEPSFTATGDILYFVHVLVDDQGVFGSNIWYVRR